MNPREIEGTIRNFEAMVGTHGPSDHVPAPVATFTMAPPLPSPSMESMAKFLVLLNERWPLNRTANFHGNHSIVYDTTGLSVGQPCIVVSIWIFKQLEWRNYPVGLSPADLQLNPEALIKEIARVLDPETEKLIVPSTVIPPGAKPGA